MVLRKKNCIMIAEPTYVCHLTLGGSSRLASPSGLDDIFFVGGAHPSLLCLLCGLKTLIRRSHSSQLLRNASDWPL
jgi:hypothetical protein